MISIDYYQASINAAYTDSFIIVCTSKMVFDHEDSVSGGY